MKEKEIEKIVADCFIDEIAKHKDIMNLFLKFPRRNFTTRELSDISGVPYSTAWRFVKKLEKLGLINTEKIGASISCSLNEETPFLREVKKILEIESSPQILAAKEFSKKVKKMKGVEKIILFGSVAKRKERLTSDVDIAVMVQRKNKDLEREITRITERILEKSRMKIVPIILTSKELEDNEQFSRELKEGEILYERTKRS